MESLRCSSITASRSDIQCIFVGKPCNGNILDIVLLMYSVVALLCTLSYAIPSTPSTLTACPVDCAGL
ncbi:hypothetical protein Y032_0107g3791 [Ancylostoma ceylanicum]|uniref:Uncharacterized protein n=1 Tax=Ancylostoma ceylanicum TaxID=53326 RepID=A0A016TFH8_9BILA|nr:hypothetical protein Y032_0107g3791 [Ancylostoma ceylanicum]